MAFRLRVKKKLAWAEDPGPFTVNSSGVCERNDVAGAGLYVHIYSTGNETDVVLFCCTGQVSDASPHPRERRNADRKFLH